MYYVSDGEWIVHYDAWADVANLRAEDPDRWHVVHPTSDLYRKLATPRYYRLMDFVNSNPGLITKIHY